MSQTIKIKRTTGQTKTNLSQGELAYVYGAAGGTSPNNFGKKLIIGNASGTPTDTPEIIGGSYYTGVIDDATAANTASKLVLRDSSGNFAAGTITAALTGNASTATALATGRTIALTGDVTYTSGSFDGTGNVTGTATLANSGVTAADYGSATAIPVLSVDAKGRITSASTAAISTSFTLSDGSNTQTVAGGDTLTVAGTSNEVEVAVSATDTLTIGLPSTVSGLTTVSATTLTGTLSTAAQTNVTSLGTLTTLTVDDITINGSTISDAGDLTVDVGGDINLDADGGDIVLLDGGTEFGRLQQVLGGLTLKSGPSASSSILMNTNGNIILGGHVQIADEKELQIGNAPDAKIYHDISDTYFEDLGTGDLILKTNGAAIKLLGGTDNMVVATKDGAVSLYHDNALKLATTSGGVQVTGDIANASGAMTIDVAGNLTLDADGGTITFSDGGSSLGTITSSGYSGNAGTATLATTVTVSDSNANTAFPIVFHDESNALLDDTGSATYNPNSGTLTATAFAGALTGNVTGNVSGTAATVTGAAQSNITSLGTLTTLTVDNVIINGTTIGHTDDTDLITVADGVVTVAGELDATTLDISGNADIDGTLEADAITVNGTALNSVIAGVTVTNATTAAVATTVTITDNENTNESNKIIFGAGAAGSGNIGLEADGDLTYNPSTGTLTVPNLTVSGTTTTVDTTNTTIKDNIIVLNSGKTGTPGTETSGIEIERGDGTNVVLRFNDDGDKWEYTTDGSSFSTILSAGNFETAFTGTIDGGTY